MTTVRVLLSALLISTVSIGHAATDNSPISQWGYKGAGGPAHWATIDSDFSLCATGKRQSPIDINFKKTSSSRPAFSLHYQPAQYLIMANGYSVQLRVPNDQQSKETLVLDDKAYHLINFHFHTPSENQLRGESAAAEVQFIYQADDGKLAVVAVFVKVGAANPVLQAIIESLPQEEKKEVALKDVLDIGKLVSAKNGAYLFDGSLTTPPCVEGVTWLVMVDVITASSEQIVKLRKAAHGANARPVQPLNKRPITFVTENAT